MSLVTVARYVAVTGDSSTAAPTVSARIEEAVELLEDDLARPLEAIERTERMWPDRAGYLYPLATPLTAATDWTVDGNTLYGGPYPQSSVLVCRQSGVAVTYTGGYVERTANPAAPNRLPVHVERDLAWAAYALGHADGIAAQIPRGATAASVGDLSISFGAGGRTGSATDMAISWSRATWRLRRRSV